MDLTAFYNGVVLKNSDEIRANWEDYYQVRPTDSAVTPGQQRPQTLRDSRTARTTVKQQQASYDRAVLEISDEKSTNWGDYYQNRLTLKDSRATRTPIKPQENNIRLNDYMQIRLRPADETAEARKENELPNPWIRPWRQQFDQTAIKPQAL